MTKPMAVKAEDAASVGNPRIVAFRYRLRKSAAWTYVDHRAPDAAELEHCEIEYLERSEPESVAPEGIQLYAVGRNAELWRGFPPSTDRALVEKQVTGWKGHSPQYDWSLLKFAQVAPTKTE